MVFRTLGEWYGGNRVFATAVNTGAIYGLVKLAGSVASGITGQPEWEVAGDVLAPATAGIYASTRTPHSAFGTVVRLGLATMVGYDLADTVMDYTPGTAPALDRAMDLAQTAFSSASAAVTNNIYPISERSLGSLIGFGGAAMGQFVEGVREGRARLPVHR